MHKIHIVGGLPHSERNCMMEQNQIIRQVLCNWVYSLPIDGHSGESIVTIDDVEHLVEELTSRCSPATVDA